MKSVWWLLVAGISQKVAKLLHLLAVADICSLSIDTEGPPGRATPSEDEIEYLVALITVAGD